MNYRAILILLFLIFGTITLAVYLLPRLENSAVRPGAGRVGTNVVHDSVALTLPIGAELLKAPRAGQVQAGDTLMAFRYDRLAALRDSLIRYAHTLENPPVARGLPDSFGRIYERIAVSAGIRPKTQPKAGPIPVPAEAVAPVQAQTVQASTERVVQRSKLQGWERDLVLADVAGAEDALQELQLQLERIGSSANDRSAERAAELRDEIARKQSFLQDARRRLSEKVEVRLRADRSANAASLVPPSKPAAQAHAAEPVSKARPLTRAERMQLIAMSEALPIDVGYALAPSPGQLLLSSDRSAAARFGLRLNEAGKISGGPAQTIQVPIAWASLPHVEPSATNQSTSSTGTARLASADAPAVYVFFK